MSTKAKFYLLVSLIVLTSCDSQVESGVFKSDLQKDVALETNFGTIIIRLSDSTPVHRNNFIKLVNQKYYDSIQFHRVINNFLIQTGNPKNKQNYEQLKRDSVVLPDLIKAEFNPNLFHKRGAINAARTGGIYNPSQASSSTQFTIIQGIKQTDSSLDASLKRVNKWLAEKAVFNREKYKNDFTRFVAIYKYINHINAFEIELTKAQEDSISEIYSGLREKLLANNFDSLVNIELESMQKYSYPEAHRQVYKEIGGAPHLDQNYTVFGQVVYGMQVVDSIAAVQTDDRAKPVEEVWIIAARMIQRQAYN